MASFVPTPKKIILERQKSLLENRRAMVLGFTARRQPPFNRADTHADLERDLSRREDSSVAQAHDVFIQIATLQLSQLPQTLQRCLLLRGVFLVVITFCCEFIHGGDAGKTNSFAMTTDRKTKCFAYIRKKMPAIRDLSGVWRASSRALCINASTIPRDDFYTRMTRQPCGHDICIAFGKQIKNAVAFQIADNRAVTLALAPSPIIDTHDAWCRKGFGHRGAYHSQKRIAAHRHGQLLR